MTRPDWTAIRPGTPLFPGDLIRADISGQCYEGVIEDFEYDVISIIRGAERTTAVVRLTQDCGRLGAGDIIPVPLATVTAAANRPPV